ncbi:MAG: hypothetical protein QXH91_09860, partial [Candidatus Bathyarchaeia archaeon]
TTQDSPFLHPSMLPPIASVMTTNSILSLIHNQEVSPVETRLLYKPEALMAYKPSVPSQPVVTGIPPEKKEDGSISARPLPPVKPEESRSPQGNLPQPGTEAYYRFQWETFYREALKDIPPVEIGQNYEWIKSSGFVVRGKLLKVDDAEKKVYIQDETGQEVVLAYTDLAQPSQKLFFPVHYAREVAFRKVQELMKEERAKKLEEMKKTSEKQETSKSSTVTSLAPSPVGSGRTETPSKMLKYDPTEAPSPNNIKPIVQEFATWMTYQNRRVGGTIVHKVYAKEENQHIILYCVTSKLFQVQDRNLRQQVTESMWRMWVRKCGESHLQKDERYVHLVLLDDSGNIIGGSKAHNSSDIWVK